MRRRCLKIFSWPLQNRRRALTVSLTMVATLLLCYLEFFREDGESLSDRFRREFGERMAQEAKAKALADADASTTVDGEPDEDYEEEEVVLFDKLNPNEARTTGQIGPELNMGHFRSL